MRDADVEANETVWCERFFEFYVEEWCTCDHGNYCTFNFWCISTFCSGPHVKQLAMEACSCSTSIKTRNFIVNSNV